MIVERAGIKFTKWAADPDQGEKILLPQSWWDKTEMVEIVADWGTKIPVNRIFEFVYDNFSSDWATIKWFDEVGNIKDSEYKLESALMARSWGTDDIVSEQSKRHNIFLLFLNYPLLLENIPRGNYEDIWGNFEEIDFARLNERVF